MQLEFQRAFCLASGYNFDEQQFNFWWFYVDGGNFVVKKTVESEKKNAKKKHYFLNIIKNVKRSNHVQKFWSDHGLLNAKYVVTVFFFVRGHLTAFIIVLLWNV